MLVKLRQYGLHLSNECSEISPMSQVREWRDVQAAGEVLLFSSFELVTVRRFKQPDAED